MIVNPNIEFLPLISPRSTAKDFIDNFGSLMAIVVVNDLNITSNKVFWERVRIELDNILSHGSN